MHEPVAVDVSEVAPGAKRIQRTEVNVGDFVFDLKSGWERIAKVQQYKAHTTVKREDGQVFVLVADEKITVFPGND